MMLFLRVATKIASRLLPVSWLDSATGDATHLPAFLFILNESIFFFFYFDLLRRHFKIRI